MDRDQIMKFFLKLSDYSLQSSQKIYCQWFKLFTLKGWCLRSKKAFEFLNDELADYEIERLENCLRELKEIRNGKE